MDEISAVAEQKGNDLKMGRGEGQETGAAPTRRAPGMEREADPVVTQMRALAELIRVNNDDYYNDVSTISDAEYDAMRDELAQLREAHPEYADEASILDEVGAAPKKSGGFAKVRHDPPMMSLDKVTDPDDMRAFLARFPGQRFYCQRKFDGISLSLVYKNGELVQAATRGNGTIGDDITANVGAVEGIVNPLPEPLDCEVRGEVVMTITEWKAHNERAEAHNAARAAGQASGPEMRVFANPRNAVSGSLRMKDPAKVAERRMRFMPFDLIIHGQGPSGEITDQLEALGFQPEGYATAGDPEQVIGYIEQTLAERASLDYEIDGCVIKIADREAYEAAGTTSRFPRGAMAFKPEAQAGQTKLRAVTWQVGKSGINSPVAELEPVGVGGTTVARATLHNIQEVRRRNVLIGDRVTVIRAGDVIPAVVGPVDVTLRDGSEQEIAEPTSCASCGGPLTAEGESRILRCTNSDACPAQSARRLQHWVSRGAADIDAVGESVLGKLSEAGVIAKPSDLYKLTYDDLMPAGKPLFEGLGKRSAERIINSIENSKELGLRRALIGWSIPMASEGTAKRLCRAGYESIEQVMAASAEELEQVEDVGPIVAQNLVAFFARPDVQQEIAELRSAGVSLDVLEEDRPVEAPTDSPLAGKSVCITGTLTVSRKEMQQLVERAGAKAVGSVSKNTDYLIVGENAGSKQAKAESLGIPVLTEAEARELIAKASS